MIFLQVPIQVSDNRKLVFIALQQQFAEACNFVAEIARHQHCYSRIRLHHMAYRATRERFPELGSQLVSNAIYAVCRATKNLAPYSSVVLSFDEFSPVFFDRHTLSLKNSMLSMLTLDGRMKFQASLTPQFVHLFKKGPLKEVQLIRERGNFYLRFCFKEQVSDQMDLRELERLV